jgi:hypothetical protein
VIVRPLVFVATLLANASALAQSLPFEVTARPIEYFRIGSSETSFGPLVFNGGLELTAVNRDFGSLSGLRFVTPGANFLSVSDNGFWISGSIGRDANGHPASLDNARIAEMRGADGERTTEKWSTDAEGLLIDGDTISVTFERDHRISTGKVDPATLEFAANNEPLPVPARELRSNRGFETLTKAPENGTLQGARVAVTEKSLDGSGNIFAGVMEGPMKGIFTVLRQDQYDISDGDFLPDGDLLLLERRFAMASGVAMRIRRINGADIKPGALVTGPVILEADMSYQIDNMECLDVWQRADGVTMISLASDDNHSILQRNLYLEFRLTE